MGDFLHNSKMMKGRTKLADALAPPITDTHRATRSRAPKAAPSSLRRCRAARTPERGAGPDHPAARSDAGATHANTEVNTERLEMNLRLALRLAANLENGLRQCHLQYEAGQNSIRQCSRSVLVDIDRITYARLAGTRSRFSGGTIWSSR